MNGGFWGEPVWSPDGKQIAFTWVTPGNPAAVPPVPNGYALRIVPADGSAGPATLTSSTAVVFTLGWHDGAIPATPRPIVARLSGGDRTATAVAVADFAYNPSRAGTSKADVAVVSRSDGFADALPGYALAAEKHGPLLLTGSAKLDPTVGNELRTVLAPA